MYGNQIPLIFRRAAPLGFAAVLACGAGATAAPLNAFVELTASGDGSPNLFGTGAFEFFVPALGEVGEGVSEIRVEGSIDDGAGTRPPACCVNANASGFGDEERRFGGTAEVRIIDFFSAQRSAAGEGTWQGIFSRDAATTEIDFVVTALSYGARGTGFFEAGAFMRVSIDPPGPAPDTFRLDQQVFHAFNFSSVPGESFAEPFFVGGDVTGELNVSGSGNRLDFGEVVIDPFTRSVDISDIPVGEEFLLTVFWGAQVTSTTSQGSVFSSFVDPADFSGGLTFDDTGLTASPFRADFGADNVAAIAAVPVPAAGWLMTTLLALGVFAAGRSRRATKATAKDEAA